MSKSWISRSRSYGLAYGRQPFKGRTHGHRVGRSPEAAEALVASGARRASSPKAHSRRVSLRNDKQAWLVGRRIRNGRSSAAIKY